MYMTLSLNSVRRRMKSANETRPAPMNACLRDNLGWLEQIIRSQRQGNSCLPYCLGLRAEDYRKLVLSSAYHRLQRLTLMPVKDQQAADLRQELLDMREDEWMSLRELLLEHRAGVDDSEYLIADIVAAACMGGDHLWRDLGLASRTELSGLLTRNFPSLASANNRDMKWKKFFYKQLCEQGGGYVCRAPSCEQCSTYSDCFGPEV